jgi:hypothetical protein
MAVIGGFALGDVAAFYFTGVGNRGRRRRPKARRSWGATRSFGAFDLTGMGGLLSVERTAPTSQT